MVALRVWCAMGLSGGLCVGGACVYECLLVWVCNIVLRVWVCRLWWGLGWVAWGLVFMWFVWFGESWGLCLMWVWCNVLVPAGV